MRLTLTESGIMLVETKRLIWYVISKDHLFKGVNQNGSIREQDGCVWEGGWGWGHVNVNVPI